MDFLFVKLNSVLLEIVNRSLREGWQRKSFVERSGTKIEVQPLTEFTTKCLVFLNFINEDAPKKNSELLVQNGV